MANNALQYIEEHTVLMEDWQQRHIQKGYRGFIQDGIVNPDLWYSQNQRILFLLKEAYNDEKNPDATWSLTSDYLALTDGIHGRIWNAVAEWIYGIAHTTRNSIPLFDKWLGVDSHVLDEYTLRRHELIQKCAVINIKKSNGRSSSTHHDLLHYVKEDADLLERQIEIINPTMIVCGATFDLVNEYRIFGDINQVSELIPNIYLNNQKIIISYYHPANQYPAMLSFLGIVTSYHHYLNHIYLKGKTQRRSY